MERVFGPLAAGQPRPALVDEVGRVVAVLPPSSSVVLACSGGPDSTVLAYLVAEARPDLQLSLAHIRHGLRDDSRDVDVVSQHAEWLDVPLDIRRVEVVNDGTGVEAAARDARYAALRGIAHERAAKAILVGHTADDQAETVLLRLARGTGIDGLAAMEPVSGDLIRPMLRIRRVDVQRFALLEGLPTVDDPTNTDPEVRRSIVRHELLRVLERVAADPIGSLVRLADLAADDRALLDELAREQLAVIRRVGPVSVIADEALAGMPLAIARRVVRTVMAGVVDQVPDADSVARAMNVPTGSAITLPGPVEVTRASGHLAFAPRALMRGASVPLAVPGAASWPPAHLSIQAITPDTDPWRRRAAGSEAGQVALLFEELWSPPPPPADSERHLPPGCQPERMVLAIASAAGPFTVRHRQPGDRIVTAAGTKSLQDLFVDVGLPRPIRDIWPVIVSSQGAVVWVPGIAADEEVLRDGRDGPAAQLRATATSRGTK